MRHRWRVRLGELLYRVQAHRVLMPGFSDQGGLVRRRLRAYLDHYLREHPVAEADMNLPSLGARFAVNLNDHMLVPYLRGEAPVYEQAEIDFFRKELRPGDHLLDIGANHGFWGISLASQLGASATLHLFEPNPTIAARLRRTLCMNPKLRAQVHQLAVSDGAADSLRFYEPEGWLSGLGSTVLHGEHPYLDERRQIEVAAASLDGLVAKGILTGMDIVKIDVEHAEDAVITGARDALARLRPRLLMVETRSDSKASEQLRALGYRATLLDSTGCELAIESETWGNLLYRLDRADTASTEPTAL